MGNVMPQDHNVTPTASSGGGDDDLWMSKPGKGGSTASRVVPALGRPSPGEAIQQARQPRIPPGILDGYNAGKSDAPSYAGASRRWDGGTSSGGKARGRDLAVQRGADDSIMAMVEKYLAR